MSYLKWEGESPHHNYYCCSALARKSLGYPVYLLNNQTSDNYIRAIKVRCGGEDASNEQRPTPRSLCPFHWRVQPLYLSFRLDANAHITFFVSPHFY